MLRVWRRKDSPLAESAQWERIEAAVAGQPVDRVPFGFWLHVPEIEDAVAQFEGCGVPVTVTDRALRIARDAAVGSAVPELAGTR